MIRYRESLISAHHNYLVNEMPTPGFVIGAPEPATGFYFLADPVYPGESTARISARIADENGGIVMEVAWNRLVPPHRGHVHQFLPDGFRILSPSGEPVLEVRTRAYTNGFLTCISAEFRDEKGILRMARLGESVQVHGARHLSLKA
ncbi:MAG: hypothetical protein DRH56_05650 [Deltaproteobacteria bacterium]|nr:MAG: hypothetical protein DRH56_05650 [Deltaproteobacteria bacterium]